MHTMSRRSRAGTKASERAGEAEAVRAGTKASERAGEAEAVRAGTSRLRELVKQKLSGRGRAVRESR